MFRGAASGTKRRTRTKNHASGQIVMAASARGEATEQGVTPGSGSGTIVMAGRTRFLQTPNSDVITMSGNVASGALASGQITMSAAIGYQVTQGTPTFANGYLAERTLLAPPRGTTTISGFVLLVDETWPELRRTTNGGRLQSAVPNDLRFELEDGTKLAHHVLFYDGTAGRLIARVRFPTWNLTNRLSCRMYYGKVSSIVVEQDQVATYQDHARYFNPFTGEDYTQGGSFSTADLTVFNVTTRSINDLPAADFDGIDSVGSSSFALSALVGLPNISFGCWVDPNLPTVDPQRGIACVGHSDNTNDRSHLLLLRQAPAGGGSGGATTAPYYTAGVLTAGGFARLESSSGSATANEHSLVVTKASATQIKLYKNGVLDIPSWVGRQIADGTSTVNAIATGNTAQWVDEPGTNPEAFYLGRGSRDYVTSAALTMLWDDVPAPTHPTEPVIFVTTNGAGTTYTLQEAVDRVVPGQHIECAAGTYTGDAVLIANKAGFSVASPLVIRAAGQLHTAWPVIFNFKPNPTSNLKWSATATDAYRTTSLSDCREGMVIFNSPNVTLHGVHFYQNQVQIRRSINARVLRVKASDHIRRVFVCGSRQVSGANPGDGDAANDMTGLEFGYCDLSCASFVSRPGWKKLNNPGAGPVVSVTDAQVADTANYAVDPPGANSRRIIDMDGDSRNFPCKGVRIYYNYFHDLPKKPGEYNSGVVGAFSSGDDIPDSNIQLRWIIHHNLFDNCDVGPSDGISIAEAVIKNKSEGCVYAFNTWLDNDGHFDLRQGFSCALYANWIENSSLSEIQFFAGSTGSGWAATDTYDGHISAYNFYRGCTVELWAGDEPLPAIGDGQGNPFVGGDRYPCAGAKFVGDAFVTKVIVGQYEGAGAGADNPAHDNAFYACRKTTEAAGFAGGTLITDALRGTLLTEVAPIPPGVTKQLNTTVSSTLPTPAWYTGTRLEQLGLTAAVTPVKLLPANVGGNLAWAGKLIGNEVGPTAHAQTSFDGEIGEFWIRAAEMPAEHVLAWHANHDDTKLFYGTSGENLPGDTNVRAPIAAPDLTTVVGDENPLINVLANDLEVGGATITIESVTQPTPAGSGTVAIESGKIRYTQPAAKLQGAAFFTYTITDQSPAKRSTAKCRLYRTPTPSVPPPTTFAFVPAAPTVSPTAPANTAISTATLGTGTGTGAGEWVLGGTHAALFELSAVTGRSTVVEKKDAITATGSKTITLTYRNEPGQVADITVSLTVTVEVVAPTAITVNPTTLTIAGNAPDDTIVTKVSINGGTGTGAFTLSGASTGFHLVAVPGGLEPLSRNLQKNGNTVISSGSKAVTINYVGDGVTLALPVSINVTTGPALAPTDILIGDSTPSVAANAAAGTDITTLTLNNSASGATGAWTLLNDAVPPAIPTYIKLSAASGSPVKIQKKTNSVIDTGDFNYVATYTEPPSVVLNEPFTLNVTSASAGITWKSGWSTDSDGTEGLARTSALATWRGRAAGCYNVYFGHSSGDGWGTNPTQIGGRTALLTGLKAAGILPILSVGTCTDFLGERTFAEINAGNADDDIRDFAQKVHTIMGSSYVVWRMAYESNLGSIGNWAYSKDTAAPTTRVNFRNAFNRVAGILVDEHPNSYVAFCLQKGDFQTVAYPGDTNITHITFDMYDAETVANDYLPTVTGNNYADWSADVSRHIDFAAARNKKTACDEWGIRHRSTRGGPGTVRGGCDNPEAIDYHLKLFRDIGSNFEWDAYFRIDRAHGADTTKAGIHELVIQNPVGTIIEGTPFKGKYYLTPADAGTLVGHGAGAGNTSLATARYKTLFGA